MQFRTNQVISLADLPIGMSGVVVGMSDLLRGRKKFTDAGMVSGTEVSMLSHAPLGGLLKVRVLGSSFALHKDDGRSIMVRVM